MLATSDPLPSLVGPTSDRRILRVSQTSAVGTGLGGMLLDRVRSLMVMRTSANGLAPISVPEDLRL